MGNLLRASVSALFLGGALSLAAPAADPPSGPATVPATPAAGATPSAKDGFDLLTVPPLPESWGAPPKPAAPLSPQNNRPGLYPWISQKASPKPEASLLPPLPVVSGMSSAAPIATQPTPVPSNLTPKIGWPGRINLPQLPILNEKATTSRPSAPPLWPATQASGSRPFGTPSQGAGERSRVTSGVIFLEEEEEPAQPAAPPRRALQLPWSLDEAERAPPTREAHREQPRLFTAPPREPPPIVPPQAPEPPVDLGQLKKKVRESAGRLARTVEVKQGPKDTIIVHVVTINDTAASYLAERILQLPEMNAPQIRLDLKVAP